jgi:hypothetical protein
LIGTNQLNQPNQLNQRDTPYENSHLRRRLRQAAVAYQPAEIAETI